MESQKTYYPVWRYWRDYKHDDTLARMVQNAMEWGLWDLPPIKELSELELDLAEGRNIFWRVPKCRPITRFRLNYEAGIVIMPLRQDTNEEFVRKFYNGASLPFDEQLKKLFGDKNFSNLMNMTDLRLHSLTPIDNGNFSKRNASVIIGLLPEDAKAIYCQINGNYSGEYGDHTLSIHIWQHKNNEITEKAYEHPKKFYESMFRDNLNYLKGKDGKYLADYLILSIPSNYRNFFKNHDAAHSRAIPERKLQDVLTRDNTRMQLPELSPEYASDRQLGLWDAWWPEGQQPDKPCFAQVRLDKPCQAANPWEAVQEDAVVCIDFGTSSTVAAVLENDGSSRLLRIDGSLEAPQAGTGAYENPTALEFVNLDELMLPWRHESWRPELNYKDIKCAALARNELRQGQRVQSGIRTIKSWARALAGAYPLRLKDEKGKEFELSPLPLDDSDGISDVKSRALDPIELYAFFLGLACNNQSAFGGRIYCDYVLTFPVKFSRETRMRILQGFRRGLLRSMPCSLASSARWKEKPPFRLRERANEPTAYAASVLPYLGIAPTEEGAAFAVFDFGGGTADFAYGLYRAATDEERESWGWDNVLDILDVSGDENLGGEHLLEMLAYELMKDPENLKKAIENKINLTLPPGKKIFNGSEMLFGGETREARANMVTLCELLRPLWENGKLDDNDSGLLGATLLNREGRDVNISLAVNKDALLKCLRKRIEEGVRAFFTAYGQAFNQHNIMPKELHILLAGNSCRSPLLKAVFDENIKEQGGAETGIIVHDELLPGAQSSPPENALADGSLAPTLKTGVALGLLHLLPGSEMGVVMREKGEEAPFLYTVGVFANNILMPVLQRNMKYGKWQKAEKIYREGVCVLGYSASPEAMEKKLAKKACMQLRFDWGEENFGKVMFVKASGPKEITVAIGDADAETPDEATARTRTLI